MDHLPVFSHRSSWDISNASPSNVLGSASQLTCLQSAFRYSFPVTKMSASNLLRQIPADHALPRIQCATSVCRSNPQCTKQLCTNYLKLGATVTIINTSLIHYLNSTSECNRTIISSVRGCHRTAQHINYRTFTNSPITIC